jgi:hypothetical protein
MSERALPFTDLSSGYRRENLSYHWDLFIDRPLLGFGVSDTTLEFFQSAHNTLLGIANAAGVGAVIAFVVAWLAPCAMRLAEGARDLVVTVSAASAATALAAWIATGPEVLVYSPATNLLPVALGVSLALPQPILGSMHSRDSSKTSFSDRPQFSRRALFGAIFVMTLLVSFSLYFARPPSGEVSGAEQRNLARADAEAYASSCGPGCSVLEEARVTGNVWRFRLLRQNGASVCIEIALNRFKRADDKNFLGVTRVRCASVVP